MTLVINYVMHYVVLAITSSLCKPRLFWFIKMLKSKMFRQIFGVNTSNLWENHCIMCKAEHMRGASLRQIFQACASCLREGKVVYLFCRHKVGFKISFLEISQCRHHARSWSNHNIVTYKFQYSWRVWTLPVQGRESYLLQWARVAEWSLAKKIALNSIGEISYREPARRPCLLGHKTCECYP